MEENENQQNIENEEQIEENKENNEENNEHDEENNNEENNIHENENNINENNIENQNQQNNVNNQANNNINNHINNQPQNIVPPQQNQVQQGQNHPHPQPQPRQNQNQLNNNNNNENNNEIQRREEERKLVELLKTKVKFLREKYDFSINFCEIILKIIKSFQDQTYIKLSRSINESLNFITFFNNSADLYSKFAKQIQDSNNIIMSSKKEEKLNDNILLDVMQKTQNTLLQNITKISTTMKQNIVNKGPLSKLHERINKIENIKNENFDKIKNINESKKKLQKCLTKYEKIFEAYKPNYTMNINNNINNNNQERPSLIDTPDFIVIIKTFLGLINKLVLDINLFIIDTKDTFYKINGLYVEINNLVKEAVLIYIQECKTIFNLDLTKNFKDLEAYYKKLEDKSSDKMFKLNKIFTTKETEDIICNLLQQYYILLCNSNSVKKELISDKNKFSIKNTNNIFLFFEWLITVSPQPIDVSIKDLIIKQMGIKRDPGFFSSWKDSVFIFTKQNHLLLFDKPGYLTDLVRVFELNKTSFRKKTDKKNKFLFELIANSKGKIMDFKGTFLFDALNQENIEEIPNLVYSAYNFP